MKSILDDSAMASYVMRKLPDNGRMWEAINWLYQEFRSRPFISNSELRSSLNGTASLAMQLLGADRAKRLDFYKNRLELDDPAEKVYEINSLLRYPIIQRRDGIWCPFPQLIAYASSRGLYLHLSEEDKNDFCSPFSVAFEAQVYNWVRRALPEADVLTESEERSLGWHGKTNDVSVISGDAALLIECKVSCLYAEAKRTAAPQAIVRDVRKQIADSQGRRGLYQLHEKIKAIRARTIPVALADRFQNVKRIFPVLLIWDDVAFANTPEVLGNIVRDELMSHDVRDFEYQIWQAEHFDWLVEYAGKELIEWVAEKFSSSNRAIDLNSYLVERTANNSLKEVLFAPAGDSRAFRTLRHLIETQGAVPRVGQI